MSRRSFIQGVLATSATAGVIAGTAAGPVRLAASQSNAFTAEQMSALTGILNRLIPSTDLMPGAGDIGVARYIEGMAVAAPNLRDHFTAVLLGMPDGDRLAVLSSADVDRLLHRVEQERAESFNVLLQAVYAGYYSSPQVTVLLGWTDVESIPEPWRPFDTRLVE